MYNLFGNATVQNTKEFKKAVEGNYFKTLKRLANPIAPFECASSSLA
jgi:hypothetical protein